MGSIKKVKNLSQSDSIPQSSILNPQSLNWYCRDKLNLLTVLLLPFSVIFRIITAFRRFLYRVGIKKTTHFPVPVIVIGNITVGGTGKTPLVIWLAEKLKKFGYSVGIVSRGYGVKLTAPCFVTKGQKASKVGDESLLIAERTNCPVVIYSKRVKAVQALLDKYDCDIVISDDGLQHYAMDRDIEVAVIDGERQLGNGFCLPAGPLREPVSRLKEVDFVVQNNGCKNEENYTMHLKPQPLTSVVNLTYCLDLDKLSGQIVHAVAGIGNPNRFFQTLRELGLQFIEHSFPDHYDYKYSDIDFGQNEIVIMTEKDAVKCRNFADDRHWFLPVSAEMDEAFLKDILFRLNIGDRKGG